MDVVDLREFYQSALGQSVRDRILAGIKPRWTAQGQSLCLGLGFAQPYLDELTTAGSLTFSFMPARQGVLHWPTGAPARSALVDEYDLPLLDASVERALVVHGLELSDSPADMLQEVWRVLAPQGRVFLIVPNRRGIWSASETTPFGHGQPFSRPQLAALLRQARFSPQSWHESLVMPPFRGAGLVRAAQPMERIGLRLMGRFAGVIVVEAIKQVYAFSGGKRVRRLVPRFSPVFLPSAQPTPAQSQRQTPSN
jgi:SAM-dependent methyltransferase